MTTRATFMQVSKWRIGLFIILVSSGLWARTGLALDADELLRAEQAFALQAVVQADDPNMLVARWAIADGYYMYRERFRFESATAGVVLGEPRFPAGKIKDDEFFGEMEIYRHEVAVEIPVQRGAGAAGELELVTVSQGCADLGVCYPPQNISVTLALLPQNTIQSGPRLSASEPAVIAAADSTALLAPAATTGLQLAGAPELAGGLLQPAGPAAGPLADLADNAEPLQDPVAATGTAAASSPAPAALSAGTLNLLDNLTQGGANSTANMAGPELPEPEFAFIPSVIAVDAQTLRASWIIDSCCYMYRKQFQFESLTANVTLGQPVFPTGIMQHDEFYGEVEIYRDKVSIDIPMIRTGADKEMELQIRFQGCADIGVCYPPQTQLVPVQLPGLPAGLISNTTPAAPNSTLLPPAAGIAGQVIAAPNANTASTANPANTGTASPAYATPAVPFVAEQDRIAGLLVRQQFWALPAFFGFGLLLAFTPCVFPMIPILSSIIVGQGSHLTQRRAFLLSLVYVLAMALTYTVAGVLAGLLGANIQVWFQNPWVLTTFAGLFVLLALSMFGFYELQMPSSWQSRLSELSNRQGGGYSGVAVMGLLSALIVGPCVAPPLIGVLTVIGSTGDAELGGTALFAMSLGMGAPLLVIGTSAGKLLPKAGVWMDRIKAVFGVLMLGVAIYLLERILPEAVAMLLWAMLLIICAVYMGALQASTGKSGWFTLARGFGVVLLVYGVLILVGVAAGGRDTLQPLRGVLFAAGSSAQQEHLSFSAIKTVDDLDRVIAQAGGRPVMLDFYADWCVSCKEMEKYTFSDPAVQAQLNSAILLQADVTANDDADQALLKRFRLVGPPAILFFGSDGVERSAYRVVGFMPAEQFSAHVGQVLQVAEQRVSQR